jgi:hypothetical protein
MNPNSSSLGVDVTFLLVGATALAITACSFASPPPELIQLARW